MAEAGEARRRQELRNDAREAYRAGDEEAEDAALEALMAAEHDGLLRDGDYDPSEDGDIPFSIGDDSSRELAQSNITARFQSAVDQILKMQDTKRKENDHPYKADGY